MAATPISTAPSPEGPRFVLIDAHQHFWTVGEHGFEWPTPDLAPIYRDFGPADLAAEVDQLGLTGSIVVQSQPNDTDTDWLLRLAATTPSVLGVVGWADLAAPDARDRIVALAAHPKFRGLRPMLQSLPEDDWILRRELDSALDAMEAGGLSLDALVFTRHLPALEALCHRRPGLAVVIDHGAKPPIANGDIAAWSEAIERLAGHPQVFCKLSGLITEASPDQAMADLAPYVRRLVQAFGPERLMWGSDWPVLSLRAGYAEWLQAAERLSGLTGEALEHLRWRTAKRFYRV